jgi:uncharacterized membrane protein
MALFLFQLSIPGWYLVNPLPFGQSVPGIFSPSQSRSRLLCCR